jgi:tRNA threonylcarbamoyladenosine modification (KEOPS) complex Cgi121 subunit
LQAGVLKIIIQGYSMKIFLIGCNLTGKPLEDALLGYEAVVVDPSKIKSKEEVELAYHLTRKSFGQKKNIVRKLKYEFLLWLSGKTDLKSAFKMLNPKNNKMILIVFSGDEKKIIKKLEAKEIKIKLKGFGDPLALERISLSRIKN